ncbi:hypothetical protein ASPZODRAFT_149689 [Penicilliopsis zonata CBS 506.65]|uniref:catechol O-methyltransferase n=1 Tax=Penicilliopsis zonata CBS 506.65 TaxID=1073090 RepID=A0A1L9STC4_9EURO|nr:hypothetical protein ASPZODRAFT_149689 [Penicilliopsis zonata CBS 506.65]OJJ50343.1 hypothetical protein ASPZODRAFT_149689 [Penicilliopsis zonata CBS 506.65]
MSFSDELCAKYPSLRKYDDDDYPESHDGREAALLRHIYSLPSLEDLRGNPSALMGAMDEFAAQQDFLISIGSDKGPKLADLIATHKPAVVVELGGYVGYSAIAFAQAMLAAASPEQRSNLRLWSLEFDPLVASIAMNFIELAGLSDIVKVVVGPAARSLKRLSDEGKLGGGNTIDLLFLDHDESLYVPDLKVCEELQLLGTGSLIVADNMIRPGAPGYREYVRGHADWESWIIKGLVMPGEFGDEIEVSKVK